MLPAGGERALAAVVNKIEALKPTTAPTNMAKAGMAGVPIVWSCVTRTEHCIA